MSKAELIPHSDGTVRVRLLDGGSFSTASKSLLHAEASASEQFRMYDWCFLISHKPTGRHVLWDVGLTSDHSLYTPWVQKNMLPGAKPVGPRRSLGEQLREQSVSSEEIDSVIFSHAHWDHCRPIKQEFPNATAFFGPGTKAFCSPGHLENGQPTEKIQWDGRFFDGEGYSTESWQELDEGGWVKWGPFEKALDYFGDGSFWIIDAPGHMPGNLSAAAKLEGPDQWVLLGGDCCHSRALLHGKAEIAHYTTSDGAIAAYLHMNLDAAKDTIDRIRKAERDHGMHIALAHDESWLVTQKDAVLMSLLGKDKRGDWIDRVKRGEEP